MVLSNIFHNIFYLFNFFSLSGTDKRVIGNLAYTLSDFKGVSACSREAVNLTIPDADPRILCREPERVRHGRG